MAQTVEEILAAAKLYTDEGIYAVVKLPSQAITPAAGVIAEVGEAFSALIVDKDEITLILDVEAYEEYQRRLRGHEANIGYWRLITFDIELESDLVGFMAVVSKTLADVGISFLALAAYSRDHILVPEAKFEAAMTALTQLQESLR
ncbi:ACT domain-containing protein [Phototrophicus methaneseepsis]|uniref:ACT domain-containing protein n=1 Tax=Phototrophicus methaneseepsis TaxID=2710758 RepID=A0A7S8E6D1_9CHLR|nr:ACT domain-containing protein [Phototrophicus methaneseepsis]QPC81128.1 ACT domain-containing protein [Phototrophicus methaneseepsis]